MAAHGHSIVPDIPGALVVDEQHLFDLRHHLGSLCHLPSPRFPGSQPVSFDEDSLQLLEKENFWVCEKSDGIRVIVLIVSTETEQEVYLVDRKFDFYRIWNCPFPHQDGATFVHSNTVLDGELVLDREEDSRLVLRLLLFDLLVCDSNNLMARPLSSRYGKLKQWIVEPHLKLLKAQPELTRGLPFEIVLKRQELAYGIQAVFKEHLPSLKHGSDGLIFTSAEAPYTAGTDRKILKWKPPEENSVDFVLEIRFPPSREDPEKPDFYGKPLFMLLMNHGSEHRYFDTMQVDDETWEQWKQSGEQYDNRVVECVWDFQKENWKILRFRDDKYEGNYKNVVMSILKSVKQRITSERLVEHAPRIKAAWKAREKQQRPAATPQHHQGHPPQQHAARPPAYQGSGGYGGMSAQGYGQRPPGPSNGSSNVLSSLKR